jgi:hypothetical protein
MSCRLENADDYCRLIGFDGGWSLAIFAGVSAVEGRAVTLYEEVHAKSRATSVGVHRTFLAQLAEMLPDNCKPIIVTDAGFRSPWFKLVNKRGWYWIGRIRNRYMVRPTSGGAWSGCKTLYRKATQTAKTLGQYEYVRSNPVLCQLVLVKRPGQGRRKRTLSGKRARSHRSLQHARAAREP